MASDPPKTRRGAPLKTKPFDDDSNSLRAALHARAEAGKNVWPLWKSRVAQVDRGDHGVVVALEDGRKLTAPLLVAADGRNSRTREAAGINVARWMTWTAKSPRAVLNCSACKAKSALITAGSNLIASAPTN